MYVAGYLYEDAQFNLESMGPLMPGAVDSIRR